MHRFQWAGLVAALALVVGACSSEDAADDQQSDGGSDADAGSAGVGGASGSGGAGGSGGESGGSGAAGGSGGAGGLAGSGTGGSAGDGVGGSAGATAGTGGSGGTGASGGSGGSGGGGGAGFVECSNTTCDLSTHICCDYHNTIPSCLDRGTLCFPAIEVECDGPEDCASGQVCCGTLTGSGNTRLYNVFECQTTCTDREQRVICGASGSCPTGSCVVSDLAPPYRECR